MKLHIPISLLLTLGACQGPAEQAGAAKDKAAAEAAGRTYDGNGANERIGAARDRAIARPKKRVKRRPRRSKRSATGSAARPISKPSVWSRKPKPCGKLPTGAPTPSRARRKDRNCILRVAYSE